jgi:hypothetical protein
VDLQREHVPSARRAAGEHARRGAPIVRKRRSISGISSVVIASPYGPLLAELSAYESS